MAGEWTVLFIGGPAAVGKTNAAKRISVVTGASLLQADDVWLALRSALPRDHVPDLASLEDRDVWRRPVKELVAMKRAIAEAVSGALELVVANHLAHDDRVVIEGAWITPEFAARAAYAGTAAGERRRAVIVLDEDPARIRESMTARGRGSDAWSPAERDAMAATQAGYAKWLRTQAILRDVPVVEARPVGRLAERILAVL